MNKTQAVGVGLISFGVIIILSYFSYELFLESTGLPTIIKFSLILVFLGLTAMLVSLVLERIKEMKK